jgi:uncharacterized cupin superfamily protein
MYFQGALMTAITVEHDVSPAKLETMGVDSWPIWRKEVSRFPWSYEQDEVCYLLEGRAIVRPANGEAVTIERGDLVHFPAGLSCTWEILQDVEKHYLLK